MPNRINIIYYYIGLIRLYIGRMGVRKKAQVLLEYAVVLTLVVSALIAIQLYLQRALQARYRDATDKTIQDIRRAKVEFQLPLQYEPYYQESDITTESDSQIKRSYSPEGLSSAEIVRDKVSRTGIRQELPFSDSGGE